MDIAYCPDFTLSVKTEGLPPGWLLVDPRRPDPDYLYAVAGGGVAYSRCIDHDYTSFWRPVDDTPRYREVARWPGGVVFKDDAPLVCPCGNDRLNIAYTGSYETSGRCPDCGFSAVVHDG